MIKVLALFFLISTVHAYVPTVESLFRYGGNADVTSNGLSINLTVKKIQPGEKPGSTSSEPSLLKDDKDCKSTGAVTACPPGASFVDGFIGTDSAGCGALQLPNRSCYDIVNK